MTTRQKYGNLGAAFLIFSLAGGKGVWAQTAADSPSPYGCGNLEQISEMPMIEGKDGMFFRVIPDIRLLHPFTNKTMDNLAEVSRALEKKGTTLIYVPVPTKSLVLPALVPERAKLYGFDVGVAEAVYDDVVHRLNEKGVVSVDIARPMRAAGYNQNGDYAFFKTDFHWTAQGARTAAEAVANRIRSTAVYDGDGPSKAELVEMPAEQVPSSMRKIIQKHCKQPVPSVSAHAYQRTPSEPESSGEGSSMDIFGSEESSTIALIGTSYSDMPISNFAGLLEHWSGLTVENYSISGGDQFGAITSYITSREFHKRRPRFLVWENPIYNNLGQYGDAPWREILAAAVGECDTSIKTAATDTNTLTGDLQKLKSKDVILADLGEDRGRKAIFQVTGSDGQVNTRTIERGDRLKATGRFFLSLRGLPEGSLNKISVRFDSPVGEGASISVCKTKLGEES